MPIDLKALDEKIKKLQLIRQLAADPDLLPLLNDVITSNGSGQPLAAQKPPAAPKGVRAVVFRHVAASGDLANYRTAREIMEAMKAAVYKFTSKDHLLTVKEQLRELEKAGLIEKAGKREDGSALWRRT